jgi:phosphate transport system substrate-binding protein
MDDKIGNGELAETGVVSAAQAEGVGVSGGMAGADSPHQNVGNLVSQAGEGDKKGRRNLIILIAGVVVVVLACVFAYFYFTKSWIFEEGVAGENQQEEQISGEPIFAAEDYPRFDASTATQPLALAFFKNFTGKSDAKLADFGLTKTHEAYVKLINNEVDLIIVTSPSEDELKLAKDKGVELSVEPVVREGFVFFVSTDNPVESLTVEQIQKIYTGEIRNWKEVGGNDVEIRAYQRQENSGSQTGMLDLVMKGKKMMEPIKESEVSYSMMHLVGVNSSYGGEPDGIGYSYYYYVTTMYQDINKNVADGIKLLAIDGVKPDVEAVKTQKYPFTTAYYVVTRGDASEKTLQLRDAMLSARGQQVALEAQYVPAK